MMKTIFEVNDEDNIKMNKIVKIKKKEIVMMMPRGLHTVKIWKGVLNSEAKEEGNHDDNAMRTSKSTEVIGSPEMMNLDENKGKEGNCDDSATRTSQRKKKKKKLLRLSAGLNPKHAE